MLVVEISRALFNQYELGMKVIVTTQERILTLLERKKMSILSNAISLTFGG